MRHTLSNAWWEADLVIAGKKTPLASLERKGNFIPLSSERLKNRALNGAELAEIIVSKLRQALASDCMFIPTIAYGRVAFAVTVTVHAFSGNVPDIHVRTRAIKEPPIEGDPPLAKPNLDASLIALEVSGEISNPNLERVHADLPITVQERSLTPATAGDPFPSVSTKEYRYDKDQYPEPAPVKVADVSAREAEKFGIPVRERKLLPPLRHTRHTKGETLDAEIPKQALDPMDELDAISTEEE